MDARLVDGLQAVMTEFRPDTVVNAIGIIKQRRTSGEIIPCIEINALFPHRLALLCRMIGARMIHLSTDCVSRAKRVIILKTTPPTQWTSMAAAS